MEGDTPEAPVPVEAQQAPAEPQESLAEPTADAPPAANERVEAPEAAKIGRPSDYSAEYAAQICERIADGESLRSICAGPHMPSRSTVFLWLRAHSDFSDQYARAREVQAELIFEECLEIADEATGDFIEVERDDGSMVERVDHENIQRSRLRVDTRKWIASKLAPKKYGEKVALEHTGKDGKDLPAAAPAQVVIVKLPDNGRG